MEMTVLVAALGIAALWIVGEAKGEHYRVGRIATTMVVVCAAALQAYFLRYAIRTDPLYLPWPLVITSELLLNYLGLLFVTRGQSSAQICANASGTLLFLPDKLSRQLEVHEQKKLLAYNLVLSTKGR